VPEKFTSTAAKSETPANRHVQANRRAWDHKLNRTEIFMTAQDVLLTDIRKSANLLRQEPSRRATTRVGFYRNVAKRAIDVTLVLLSAPFVVPVILVLALFILKDGGKPFYRQGRIGKGGRTFNMWKLRSMVHDADNVLDTYLEQNPTMRAEWDTKQKLLEDPRVTRLGRFIRKTSIDELPQLLNVLRGDMALVGPRPMMIDQQKLYHGRDYYDVRPGITGFWQISDRNETSFADRVFYDARYNNKLSLKTDVKILLATVRVVLRGTGC
jgi:lipopolysaccharide/colanic/teichoic acid biosynthesis glycosyltransferase